MDHNQAVQGRFAERYLLGELTPAKRDQFEEHFFDCPICSEDVHTGAVFVDNARSLLRSEEAAAVSPRQHAPYGLPFQSAAWAFVLLLGIFSYENIVMIPHLRNTSAGVRAPEVLPTVSLLDMGSRAQTRNVTAPAGRDFAFELEVPGSGDFSSYLCEIAGSNGVKFSLPITSAQAKAAVRLAIPGSALSSGKYEIVILGEKPGQPAQELSRIPFLVQ